MQPFVERRERLQKNLHSTDAFLIHQPGTIIRNGDVHYYPYHPNRYFYYLTGFDEPSAWLLLTKDKAHFWSTSQDANYTLWNGPVLAESSIDELQVDTWSSSLHLNNLNTLLKNTENLFIIGDIPQSLTFDGNILDGKSLVDHMRIIKDRYEINVISKACEITANAHNYLMQHAPQSKHEAELMGLFIQKIMAQGAMSQAYPPIIACGKNALTLHYSKNNQVLSHSEMVLVDAGCEYQQYVSDISRTFPASGKFSAPQQALYEACLDVQTATIKQVRSKKTFNELQEYSVLRMTQHLIDLGIIKTSFDIAIEDKLYQNYFPHRVGHTLGLDVHDIPSIDDTLHPGMIITIEPGIYIRDEGKYKNMGIRIEDDILVTELGYKNLTINAAKSIKDIHHLMKS